MQLPLNATAAQQATVDYFVAQARENGSTIGRLGLEVDFSGNVYITETASANYDHEQNAWRIDRDGNAELL